MCGVLPVLQAFLFFSSSDQITDSTSTCAPLHRTCRMHAIRILRCRCTALRSSPVNPFEQHRELRRAHRHRTALRLRPHEFAIAQPFAEKTYPIAAVPQNFHFVAAAAAEDKNMTRVWA